MTNKPDITLSTGKIITRVRVETSRTVTTTDEWGHTKVVGGHTDVSWRAEVLGGGDMTDAEWTEYADRAKALASGITATVVLAKPAIGLMGASAAAWVAQVRMRDGRILNAWKGTPDAKGRRKVERLARKFLDSRGLRFLAIEGAK